MEKPSVFNFQSFDSITQICYTKISITYKEINSMYKNPNRIGFQKKCDEFYLGADLLKFIIVYYFPICSILVLLTAATLFNHISHYSKEQFIFFFLFQIALAACLFIARKKAFILTKEAWYYILMAFGGICVNGIITEGTESIPLAIILFVLFFCYMYKRRSLFKQGNSDE